MKSKLIIAGIVGLAALSASAESLLVVNNGVTYSYPVTQVGEMVYSDGSSLKILGKTFSLSEVESMAVDNSMVTENTINIVYSGSSASVTIDGLLAEYIDVDVTGAHVSITQHSDYTKEITYTLSGSTTNGSFLTTGSYKSSIELHGLTLTNPNGAALSFQNGKRNKLTVKEGTTNTLTDGSNGSQKGCIACKGHLEIKGKGSLTLTGKTADGIHASEYVTLKNATVSITSAVKDGLNCNQYFTMESGSLTIAGVGDEGIQVDYKDDSDRDAEDTGSITISGGTIDVNSPAAKGIKAQGDIYITDGDISVYASGSNAEGIESKSELYISGGNIYVNAYDDGINSSSHMYIQGGTITVISRNNDGLDSNGNMYIQGGTIIALGATSPECGIDANEEERYSVIFTGGTLLAIGGSNSVPSTSASTQAYVSVTVSVSAGSTVGIKSGSTELASFTIPSDYTSSGSSNGGMGGGFGGGFGGPGGNSGGSSSQNAVITCPGLTSGSSYTVTYGSSSTSGTAKLTGSSSSGGGRW